MDFDSLSEDFDPGKPCDNSSIFLSILPGSGAVKESDSYRAVTVRERPRATSPNLRVRWSPSQIIFLARVQLFDILLEILDHSSAPDLHRGGQFALLDAQLPLEYPVLPDLLERRKLFVDALHRAAHLLAHRARPYHVGRRRALQRLHPL